ncbi:SRPBCC domain-containing protein [Mesorhizobium sp. VK24D]|uniref:SRPBCC domain-containing protein n=1 Tax=Mesorhizobium album TaxID=3072314 RepID=A0ABU4XQI6_9HYPH|nr:SRPBCC domain-containing protein [Mesorhizobium sp. VK24D]MDX8477002.1 SRPBCC domain-containing protein [Mesorhizobium sp. VK24D]
MTNDLRFEFVADKDERRITVIREFDADRQLVWDCHTKSELLDQWFAPKPLTTQTKHMDFREGGYWHYAMITPDNEKYWNRLDYKTIDPIDGYTAQDGFCDETGAVNPDLPGSHWDGTFADEKKRTLVTTVVQYASADSLQAAIDMGLKDGLASTLERLDELLLVLQEA